MGLNKKFFNLIYFIVASISLFLSCYILDKFIIQIIFVFLSVITLLSFCYFKNGDTKKPKKSDIVISIVLTFLFLLISGIFSKVFQMGQISLSTIFVCSSFLVFNVIYLIQSKIKNKSVSKTLLWIGIIYSFLLFIFSIINVFVPIIQVK